jgi:glucan biosynthesis protein C
VLQAEPGSPPGYLAFLRRYFDPGSGLFTTAHLWFLGDLFLFSALLLPLFLALRLPAGERRLAALAGWLARPAAIWLLALPIALLDIALGAVSNGGWRQETFAVFLLCGYLLATDPRYAEAMGRAWRPALAAGLLLALVYAGGAFYLSEAGVDPTRDYDWGSVAWRALKSLGAWAWMIAILGFGSRPRPPRGREHGPGAARPGGRALAYAGEAFLPFYILHQTIVFVIGSFVVQWAIAAPLKYLAISLSALAATLLLYELAIRRFNPARRLFGLRPAPRGRAA